MATPFEDCINHPWEDYGWSDGSCDACGQEVKETKVAKAKNFEEFIVCYPCLQTRAIDIIYRPKKKADRRWCSICEGDFENQMEIPYRSKKYSKANFCNRCISHPSETSKLYSPLKKIVNDQLKKIKAAEIKHIDFINSAIVIAQPYIEAGLSESFAMAVGKGVNPDDVLSLWEAEWWKQYPPDDILICAVLDGTHSEENGRWLNDIRSDHHDLAMACISQKITVDWAKALLDCGFDEFPKSVIPILKGADPEIISRLHKISVQSDLVPQKLNESVIEIDSDV